MMGIENILIRIIFYRQLRGWKNSAGFCSLECQFSWIPDWPIIPTVLESRAGVKVKLEKLCLHLSVVLHGALRLYCPFISVLCFHNGDQMNKTQSINKTTRKLKMCCSFVAAVDSGSVSKDRVNIATPVYRIPGIHLFPFLLSHMCILMSRKKNSSSKTTVPLALNR